MRSSYKSIVWIMGLSLFVFSGCGGKRTGIRITGQDIENYSEYAWQDDFTKFPFTGNISISSKEYTLDKGKYSMRLRGFGSPGENRLPRIQLSFGPYHLKHLTVELQTTSYQVNFELPEKTTGKFAFTFNDDYNSPTEDRNVFIFFPVIVDRY